MNFFSQYIRKLREQIYEARDMRGVPLLVVGNKQDELSSSVASGTRYRDIVNLVRKHWRCGYIECSARFNCRVVQVFFKVLHLSPLSTSRLLSFKLLSSEFWTLWKIISKSLYNNQTSSNSYLFRWIRMSFVKLLINSYFYLYQSSLIIYINIV